MNVGSTAGISIGGASVTLENSKLNFTNSGTGGLNLNNGKVVFKNSEIKGNGKHSGSLFGVQDEKPDSRLTFEGSSLVETPAAKNSDNGLDQLGKAYIVMGGSHRIYYSDAYFNGAAIPVNAPEQGGEKLSHFKLASSALTELKPMDVNGAPYTYPVEKASSDGEKYVWVPAAKATFKLNNPAASFADGTTADKEVPAMRGYKIVDAAAANGKKVELPKAPAAIGWKFLGWGVGADGAETPFDPAQTSLNKDVEIKALWEADAASYGAVYHVSKEAGSPSYQEQGNRPDRKMTAAAFDAVAAANPAFVIDGTEFITWENENGEAVVPGSTFTVPHGKDAVHLYAKWKDTRVTVRFSANGGQFTANSVFKKFPKAFTIEKNANGGETALLNEKIAVGGTIDSALKAAGVAQGAAADGIKAPDSGANGIKNCAEKKYFKMAEREESLLFWTATYYDWYYNAEGTGQPAAIKADTTVVEDTVFYLKWTPDTTLVSQIVDQTRDLPADMWGAGMDKATSAKAPFVRNGQVIDMAGAISTTVVKEQMKAIETLFNENDHFENILLSDVKSSFEATLTIASGIDVPQVSPDKIKITGFADTFAVTEAVTTGGKIRMKMRLKDGIANYKELKEAVDKLDDWMILQIDGFKMYDPAPSGKLVSKGEVKGSFAAVAVKDNKAVMFDLKWKGVQTPEGKDEAADAADNSIRFTVETVQPVALTIPGDMLVNEDTEHNAVYPVLRGDTVKLSGKIDITPVRDQMSAIENQFNAQNIPFENIKITGLAGGQADNAFVAEMTVPGGLTLPNPVEPIHNFGPGFEVKSAVLVGGKLRVEMRLADGLTNYRQLHDAVFGAGTDGWLKLDIPGARVDDTVAPGREMICRGTMEGHLEAIAATPASTRAFAFTWEAEQWPDGKDAAAGGDTSIRVTMAAPAPVALDLDGDILVNGDTEHDAVYPVKQGDRVTLTGALNMAPVKTQMRAIEGSTPPAEFESIRVSVKENRFTAVLTLPEDLSFPAGLNAAAVVSELGNHYKVDGVSVSGRTVRVEMVLKNTVNNYKQLREAVMDSPDWLKISIPGVLVSQSAAPGKHLTVRGEVNCVLRATAQKGGTTRAFSFVWNGKQWPDGRDAAANAADTTIRLTMKPAARPAATPAPKMPPKTGDGAAPRLWKAMALASFAAAALLKAKRKSENN